MTGESGPGPTDLSRLTVNLTPRARAAMHAAAQMLDDSNTDVVNVALMLYAQLVEMGQHEGVYRVTADSIDGRPLYLKVSRQPWRRWLPW